MTENIETQEEATPELHPMYKPAEADGWIKIKFVGNTAVIHGYDASAEVTPYHMLGAAEDMKRVAFKMIQFAEIREAEERQKREAAGIQTATKLPTEPLHPGGFRHGG